MLKLMVVIFNPGDKLLLLEVPACVKLFEVQLIQLLSIELVAQISEEALDFVHCYRVAFSQGEV